MHGFLFERGTFCSIFSKCNYLFFRGLYFVHNVFKRNFRGYKSGYLGGLNLKLLFVDSITYLVLFHLYSIVKRILFFSSKAKFWIKDALSYLSQHSTMNSLSFVFGIWAVLSLAIGYILEGDHIAGYESLLIGVLLVVNVSLELYDNKLRHNEVPNRIRAILQKLESEIKNIQWTQENYPDLCSPPSPCITLQWTYRDGKLVNLPWALLVKDDIILIRPGNISFIFLI